jgi:hypothetical protein
VAEFVAGIKHGADSSSHFLCYGEANPKQTSLLPIEPVAGTIITPLAVWLSMWLLCAFYQPIQFLINTGFMRGLAGARTAAPNKALDNCYNFISMSSRHFAVDSLYVALQHLYQHGGASRDINGKQVSRIPDWLESVSAGAGLNIGQVFTVPPGPRPFMS